VPEKKEFWEIIIIYMKDVIVLDQCVPNRCIHKKTEVIEYVWVWLISGALFSSF
jgi:hypothetical protein